MPTDNNQLMGSVINTAGGLIGGMMNQSQQQSYNNQALSNSAYLANLQHRNDLDFWEKTGIKGQIRQANEAGVNIGALMKNGGQAGQTGNAMPTIQPAKADKGSMMAESMQATAMAGLVAAQTEAAKAQANKDNATADKTRGADTENTNANTQYTNLQSAKQVFDNKIAEIDSQIATDTKTDQVLTIQANAREAIARMESAEAKADVDQATINKEIERIGYESVGAMLENKLKLTNIKLTRRQTAAITDQLTQGFIQAYAAQRNSYANEKNAETNVYNQMQDGRYKTDLIELGHDKLNQDLVIGVAGMASGKIPVTTTSATTVKDASGKLKGEKVTRTTTK